MRKLSNKKEDDLMTTPALRRLAATVISVLIALPLLGGAARRGWTKLELVDVGKKDGSTSKELARTFGGEVVSDYGSFAIVYAPEAAVGGLTTAARARGITVRRRDDLDLLRLPGGDLDTREGIGNAPRHDLILDYPKGKPGLFVLQLAGPPRQEWIAELHSMGWTLARYVPNNGYIAIGSPALRASTKKLSYIQWIDIFQPHQKNAYILRNGVSQPLVFDLPSGPALEETIAAIQAEADATVRVYRGAEDTLVYATMPHGKAEKILRQQLVIGVSGEATAKLSDERQVMSLTSQLDSTRSRPSDSSPTTYWSWVTSGTHCIDCADMPSDQWKISIADSGLDDGIYQPGHFAFAGRVTKGGLLFEDPNMECPGHKDCASHGTMVAGIAAGNGAVAPAPGVLPFRDLRDDDPSIKGWYLGTGVAPTAGILVTKISKNSDIGGSEIDIRKWIDDAVSVYTNGNHSPRVPMVTIQNHSWEHTTIADSGGRYSRISREYDLRVRDANGNAAGRPEIFISIAAGNYDSPAVSPWVATGAMAKNVLTVSGTENWRNLKNLPGDVCNSSGSGFRNIMARSRMGSLTDGYIKPDVMAPASQIVSAWPLHLSQNNLTPTICPRFVRGYYDTELEDSGKNEYGISKHGGTSFAAPVGAGAALIVKRYLGNSPQATSPALTKAMLIAGAESIRDGEDHSVHPGFPGTTISSVPSTQQGFGRLSFEDILIGTRKPFTLDQNPGLVFTRTGDSKSGRLRVRDYTKPVKVVLVWSDAAATPAEGNEFAVPLVNDLDLEIRPTDGPSIFYLGNRMCTGAEPPFPVCPPETSIPNPTSAPDRVNNVEYARFSLEPNQEFDVTVRAIVIGGDTDGVATTFEQDFALVVLNADIVSPFICPSPHKPSPKLRVVRHLRAPNTEASGLASARGVGLDTTTVATILPGEPVTLEIVPQAGVTYKWFEGDDYNDVGTELGSGPALTIAPAATSTYWVRATAVCPTSSQSHTDSDFFVVEVSCTTSILTGPAPAAVRLPSGGGSAEVSTSVVAAGNGELHYQWHDAAGNPIGTDSPRFTWSSIVAANSPAQYKDVFVVVTVRRESNGPLTCPVASPIVRLFMVPGTPQTIFAYTPGATIYRTSWPDKLRVVMDPPASADDSDPNMNPEHEYQYEWYRDDGTPDGELLSSSAGAEIYVTTNSIDTFWVKVTGTHRYASGPDQFYTEVTVSKKMYVSLLGTCEMPRLSVTQNTVTAVDSTQPVTFTAFCDWPNVEFTWYRGQTGDTRYPVDANVGMPHQLTVPTNSIQAYWVRASLECGSSQDSMTLTHTRGSCSPLLMNQYVPSVEVAHGETAFLEVDPLAGNISYTWYQSEGTNNQVFDDDGMPTRLTRENVRKSGLYWVRVESPGCGNAASSYLATMRVASHPSLTPRTWPSEVWTGYGTGTTLDGTMTGATGYQWYMGEIGDESGLIAGAVSASYITPSLTAETKYWVRVSAGQNDGTGVDSPTVTIKICQSPAPTDPPHYNQNVVPGGAALISVQMEGTNLQYQWYLGAKYDTASPIDHVSSVLPVAQTTTTKYWVKVTAGCEGGGPPPVWSSETFTASVCPDFAGDEKATATSTLVNASTIVTLAVDVVRGDYIEWYSVTGGGAPMRFAEGAHLYSVPSLPITQQTSFYAIARSGNCTRQSGKVTVEVCSTPHIHWGGGSPPQVAKGATFSLEAGVSQNETANFAFYRETAPEVWTLVHSSSNVYQVNSLQTTTRFKVRATDPVTGCHDDSTIRTVSVCIPTILTQPQSVMINSGGTTTLRVVTDDLAGISYEWYRGQPGDTSSKVNGALTNELVVTTAGTYWVRVFGCPAPLAPISVDSAAATVSICAAPAITTQPQPTNHEKNFNLTVNVIATGNGLHYQWYEGAAGDTTKPVGTDSDSYTHTTTVSKRFWVRVTGTCGSVDSTAALQSVTPDITTQPVGGSLTKGTTRTLTVASNGTELTYKWYQRTGATSAEVSGQTGPSFTTPAINSDTTYFCRVTSGVAVRDSNDAVLMVCLPNAFTATPTDDMSGSTVRLSVTTPLAGETFQWYRGATGTTTNPAGTGAILDLQPLETTQYWLRTTRASCSADSAALTVNVCRPKVTPVPTSVTITAGESTTLSVTATGTGTLSYQWYNGTPGSSTVIPGVTSNSYLATPAVTTTYWVVVTSSSGCANRTTEIAIPVTVCQPPQITVQPQPSSSDKNVNVPITVTATGSGLHYQWYEGAAGDVTKPVGTDSSTYTYATTVSKRFWVRVTGSCIPAANSTDALQSVKPDINTQPAGGPITKNATRTLTVVASGTDLSYQWYQRINGTINALSGKTSASFLTPAIDTDSTYFCRVTSGTGQRDSNDAVLTVCLPNAFTSNGSADLSGAAVRLTITNPLAGETFQWYRGASGDVSNPAGTGAVNDVSPLATTQYWVRTTRPSCSADSAATTVNVCRPSVTAQPASASIVAGTSVSLSVTATGTGPLLYQWYSGTPSSGTLIQGATSSSYLATPSATTTYYVEVTASSSCANRSTQVAVPVTVCQPAAITAQSAASLFSYDDMVTIEVTATGDSLHYQWYEGQVSDTSKPVGTDNRQYTFQAKKTAYYWVRVTSSCGTPVNSSAIWVSVRPRIDVQPANTVACGVLPQNVTFTVTAKAAEHYQWYRKFTGQAAQTIGLDQNTLTTSVTTTAVEYYVVLTSGQAPALTSTKATVSNSPAPTVTDLTAPVYQTTKNKLIATVATADYNLVNYKFYQGALGDTSTLVGDTTSAFVIVTAPYKPITYWVRVSYLSTGCFSDRSVNIP